MYFHLSAPIFNIPNNNRLSHRFRVLHSGHNIKFCLRTSDWRRCRSMEVASSMALPGNGAWLQLLRNLIKSASSSVFHPHKNTVGIWTPRGESLFAVCVDAVATVTSSLSSAAVFFSFFFSIVVDRQTFGNRRGEPRCRRLSAPNVKTNLYENWYFIGWWFWISFAVYKFWQENIIIIFLPIIVLEDGAMNHVGRLSHPNDSRNCKNTLFYVSNQTLWAMTIAMIMMMMMIMNVPKNNSRHYESKQRVPPSEPHITSFFFNSREEKKCIPRWNPTNQQKWP